MNVLQRAARVVGRTADATTSAAGAVGGAAINGVVGGVQGTAAGLKSGLSTGSNSTPAAALTLAAIGAAGLVEWPVLLAVGGTALVVRQLNQRSAKPAERAAVAPVKRSTAPRPAPRAAVKATKSAKPSKAAKPAKASKTSPRKTAARSRRAPNPR
jgi:hypothetical protein